MTGASKWQPGQSGNPKGRPPNQHGSTLRDGLMGDVPEVLKAITAGAKAGDADAARLFFDLIRKPE